jgi:hypothetical protein
MEKKRNDLNKKKSSRSSKTKEIMPVSYKMFPLNTATSVPLVYPRFSAEEFI